MSKLMEKLAEQKIRKEMELLDLSIEIARISIRKLKELEAEDNPKPRVKSLDEIEEPLQTYTRTAREIGVKDGFIPAIKFLREKTAWGLIEAKKWADIYVKSVCK